MEKANPKKVVKDPVRYKTVMCNKFETLGKCPYGPRCQFAHGAAELRERAPLKPTQPASAASEANTSNSASERDEFITPPPSPRESPRESQASAVPQTIQRHKKMTPLDETSCSDMGAAVCGVCDEIPPFNLTTRSSTTSFDALERPRADSFVTVDQLTGQVICRRDASHNTQSVRRTISFLFAEESDSAPTPSWSNGPFDTFGWVKSGPLDTAATARLVA